MRLLVSIVLLLGAANLHYDSAPVRQEDWTRKEIAALVAQLSWDSVGGECQMVWHIFPAGAEAKRLVQIGKPATDELINAVEDEPRGVAAHLILTNIWELKSAGSSSEFKEIVNPDDPKHTDYIYVYNEYNGLKWTEIVDLKNMKMSYVVEQADLGRTAEEWRRKLSQPRKPLYVSRTFLLTNKYSSGA